MPHRSLAPRLTDIVEAIERIRHIVDGLSYEGFEADGEKQWAVQRGIEIISEFRVDTRQIPDLPNEANARTADSGMNRRVYRIVRDAALDGETLRLMANLS
jgi:uncharacterized protein with HEPN domain